MIFPTTRYRDPEAALAFMRDVLGLEEHAVYRSDNGEILHAQMRAGAGLLLFGPPNDGPFDRYMADPPEIGGRETTTIYVVVEDVAERHERARGAGATILLPFADQPYGGQAFTLADPEGHIWTFGNYDPFGGK